MPTGETMANPEPPAPADGRFRYDGLDRIFHEKARLSIVTSLVAHPKGLAFGDLKAACGLTDGNLSRHLQALKQEDIIAIDKSFEANRPHTACRITRAGRERYLQYLAVLEQVVLDAKRAVSGPSLAAKRTRPASP